MKHPELLLTAVKDLEEDELDLKSVIQTFESSFDLIGGTSLCGALRYKLIRSDPEVRLSLDNQTHVLSFEPS